MQTPGNHHDPSDIVTCPVSSAILVHEPATITEMHGQHIVLVMGKNPEGALCSCSAYFVLCQCHNIVLLFVQILNSLYRM